MGLTFRTGSGGKGSALTIEELDNNFRFFTSSFEVSGSISGSFSGSFVGDGSGLTGVISASYAESASVEVIKEISSSYAETASILIGQPSIDVTNITASGNISSSGDITANNIYVDLTGKIYGNEAYDNYLTFNASSSLFKVQSKTYIKFDGSSAQREVTVNEGTNDIDFVVKGASNNPLFKTVSATNQIGTHGTGTPSADFHIGGNLLTDSHITASSNISASGDLIVNDITASGDIVLDEDQRIYFEEDKATWAESHAADSFRVVVNSRQMLLLDEDTGNRAVFGNGTKVFIGENNNKFPTASLHVAGDIWASGSNSSGIDGHITASGNIKVGGDLYVTEYIRHIGDDNTNIRFTDNKIQLSAGNMIFFAVDDDDAAPFTATVNGGGNKINFRALDENQDVLLKTDSEAYSVELYHAGNKKLETTTGGINITGSVTASGNISSSGIFYGDGSGLTNLSVTTSSLWYNATTFISSSLPIQVDGAITASGAISASKDITLGHTINYAGYVAGTTNYMFTNTSYQESGGYRLGFLIATGSTVGGTAVKISGSNEGSFVGIGVPYTTPLTTELTVSGSISASNAMISTTGSFDVISRVGDPDTRILFTDDDINIRVGGINMIDFTEDTNDEITINEDSADLDVRIEGEDDPNLLFTDASTPGRVGIGTNTPSTKFEVAGEISASGFISTDTNITASGNISGSGTGIFNNLQVNGASVDFSNLPTSDPAVAGRLWNDSNTLKISAG